MNITDIIQKYLLEPFAKIFGLFIKGTFKTLRDNSKGLSGKELIKDVGIVLLSVSALLALNIVAFFIFIKLPQGGDALLVVIDKLSSAGKEGGSIWGLVFLVMGLTCWAVFSEFSARYAIYVTDNSAKSISAERVAWRKAVQELVANLFLVIPFVTVLLAVTINYFTVNLEDNKALKYSFYITFGLVFVVFYGLAYLYFGTEKDKKADRINNAIEKGILPDFIKLTKEEEEWTGKLYGIYNNFVFTLFQEKDFSDQPHYIKDKILNDPNENQLARAFPQSGAINTVSVNEKFKLIDFKKDAEDGRYRWIYFIPNSFFPHLHQQVKWVIGLTLAWFLGVCLLPVEAYEHVETLGLICMAFASASGLYVAFLYVDFALLRNPAPNYSHPVVKRLRISKWQFVASKVSLRFVLLLVVCFFSVINNDHPARTNNLAQICEDKRPSIQQHFNVWMQHFMADTSHKRILKTPDSVLYAHKNTPFGNDDSTCYPVVFVCAEGGALRTGAFTALFLSRLQDSLIKQDSSIKKDSLSLKNSIYAMSGVSGGSVGLSLFNALAYLNNPADIKEEYRDSLYNPVFNFFKRDYLSATIGKLLYGETLNLLWPERINILDRAVALEKSWEDGYATLLKPAAYNVFARDFLRTYSNKTYETYPAWFINTTEVETGRQCWMTNVRPDSFMLQGDRDLLKSQVINEMNYSTAVNFSSRFPVFSPAAMLSPDGHYKRHYVDGGYYENSGAGTMLEILQVLKDSLIKYHVKPYVLVFRYADDGSSNISEINFGNSYKEIIGGIYNTRTGHTNQSLYQLEKFVDSSLHGHVISMALDQSTKNVPLSWIFSEKTLSNLTNSIDNSISHTGQNELRKMYFFQGSDSFKKKLLSSTPSRKDSVIKVKKNSKIK